VPTILLWAGPLARLLIRVLLPKYLHLDGIRLGPGIVRGLIDGSFGVRCRIVVPGRSQGRHDHIGILWLAKAAVIPSQGTKHIAPFDIQIVSQNDASIAKIGPQAKEVVLASAYEPNPEWHDLHVSPRTGIGYRVLAKVAFHLNDRQKKLGVEACACRFVVNSP
jgi:hypothetical protein